MLVERLLAKRVPSAALRWSTREWKAIRTFPGRGSGALGAKLRALGALVAGRQADAIVAVHDRDGADNRSRIDELNEGRDFLQANGKRCAVGLAIEMIEAWLLADQSGLSRALGRKTQTQPDPEALYAGDRTSENYPKSRLARLIDASPVGEHKPTDYTFHYAAIAQHADLGVLERRCPKGFQPFAEQVRTLPD